MGLLANESTVVRYYAAPDDACVRLLQETALEMDYDVRLSIPNIETTLDRESIVAAYVASLHVDGQEKMDSFLYICKVLDAGGFVVASETDDSDGRGMFRNWYFATRFVSKCVKQSSTPDAFTIYYSQVGKLVSDW